MTDHANSIAREVHSLLLETHPEAHEVYISGFIFKPDAEFASTVGPGWRP
jgi:hypothetical protein